MPGWQAHPAAPQRALRPLWDLSRCPPGMMSSHDVIALPHESVSHSQSLQSISLMGQSQ